MAGSDPSHDAEVIAGIVAANPDGISTVGLLGWGQLRIGPDFDDARLRAALTALGPAAVVDGGFVRPARRPTRAQPEALAPSRPEPSAWATGGGSAQPSTSAGPRPGQTFWRRPPARTRPAARAASGAVRWRPLAAGFLLGVFLLFFLAWLVPDNGDALFGLWLLFIVGAYATARGLRSRAEPQVSTASAVLIGVAAGMAATIGLIVVLVLVGLVS